MSKKKNEDSIKLKLKVLIDDYQSLQELSQNKFPIKPSYWIGRILSKVKSEVGHYNETRDEFVKRFGEEKEGGNWVVKDENLPEFYEEVKKLQEVETDLDFNKIDIKELGEVSIEPRLLLDWVFNFDEK